MLTNKVLKRVFKGTILLSFIMIMGYLIQNFDIFNVDKVMTTIHDMAEMNSVKIPFVLISTVLLIFFVPISAVAGMAGLVFGMRGIIFITVSGLMAAVISYLFARIFREDAEKWVEKFYGKKEREVSLDEMYERIKLHGFSYALFIRALPFMNYSAGNLIFGVSNISFMDYVTTTLITVVLGQGINVFLVAMASDITEQRLGTLLAVILKGIYYYLIYFWSKKNSFDSSVKNLEAKEV